MNELRLIMKIKQLLNQLLKSAPEEDTLDDNILIEFYANAQNLKESIDQLKITYDKGLTPDQVKELMDYIQKNNSWANMYECHENGRKTPKYYSMSMRMNADTRDGTVWSITFYSHDKDVTFRTGEGYNLLEKVYEFLDETNSPVLVMD